MEEFLLPLEFGFVSQVEKREKDKEKERKRKSERDAFKRVPDASYASNIAMQAWNIGRTLERSFIYLPVRHSKIVTRIYAYPRVDAHVEAYAFFQVRLVFYCVRQIRITVFNYCGKMSIYKENVFWKEKPTKKIRIKLNEYIAMIIRAIIYEFNLCIWIQILHLIL